MKVPFRVSALSLVDLYRLGSFIMGFDDEEASRRVDQRAILDNVNPPAAEILGRAVAEEILARERGETTGVVAVKVLEVHPDADPRVRETYFATLWHWFKLWRETVASADMPELASVLQEGESAVAERLSEMYERETNLHELLFGGII